VWQIIGQTRAVSLLQRSLESGTLAHAYLFVGPPHVGKMTLTIELARALNCEAEERPCGVCTSCQKIASNKHADVQVIGLAGNGDSAEAKPRAEIGIGQIKELQHSSNLPPFEGKCKVFIIDGAEQLSSEAANCLLKSLEEPAENVLFLLLTANDRLLPDTVLSRCQRVELLPMAAEEVETALNGRWDVEVQKAKLLARLSHGCLGWAIMAAFDDDLLLQRSERIDRLIKVINGDCEERFAYAAQLADQFGQNRGLVWEVLETWLGWWRDLLLVKLGCGNTITNVDLEAALGEMAEGYTLPQIRAFIKGIQEVGEQLKQNANPRLALEVLMLGIPQGKEHSKEDLTSQFSVNYG